MHEEKHLISRLVSTSPGGMWKDKKDRSYFASIQPSEATQHCSVVQMRRFPFRVRLHYGTFMSAIMWSIVYHTTSDP